MFDVVDAAVAIAESNTQQVDDEIVLLKSDTEDLRTLLPEVAAGARIVGCVTGLGSQNGSEAACAYKVATDRVLCRRLHTADGSFDGVDAGAER